MANPGSRTNPIPVDSATPPAPAQSSAAGERAKKTQIIYIPSETPDPPPTTRSPPEQRFPSSTPAPPSARAYPSVSRKIPIQSVEGPSKQGGSSSRERVKNRLTKKEEQERQKILQDLGGPTMEKRYEAVMRKNHGPRWAEITTHAKGRECIDLAAGEEMEKQDPAISQVIVTRTEYGAAANLAPSSATSSAGLGKSKATVTAKTPATTKSKGSSAASKAPRGSENFEASGAAGASHLLSDSGEDGDDEAH